MQRRTSKAVPTKDYDDIVAVVAHYENGLATGTWDTITHAFDDDAIMYGYNGEDLSSGSYKNLEAYVQQFGAAPNGHARVEPCSSLVATPLTMTGCPWPASTTRWPTPE